jgi:hypothetical protein
MEHSVQARHFRQPLDPLGLMPPFSNFPNGARAAEIGVLSVSSAVKRGYGAPQ